MTAKCIIGVSKKHNSVWRMYFLDIDDNDNTKKLFTEKINPLLVWYYKLKKQKLHNNTCDICANEFRFYHKRFAKIPDQCSECDPDNFD